MFMILRKHISTGLGLYVSASDVMPWLLAVQRGVAGVQKKVTPRNHSEKFGGFACALEHGSTGYAGDLNNNADKRPCSGNSSSLTGSSGSCLSYCWDRIMDYTLKVEFMMWGQSCRTEFHDEKAALEWLRKMFDKGWLYPLEIVHDDVVLYDQREIFEKIGE